MYLFSKNSTVPYNGYTKLYRVPATAGTYTAALVDSFYTGDNILTGSVTAADISPDKKRMILLCYGKIFCFSEFTEANFFKGRITQLEFTGLTLKEGVCFKDNCQIFITDEAYLATGRKLYALDICPLTTGLQHSYINPSIQIRAIYPNPASNYIHLQYKLPLSLKTAELVMYTLQGKEIMRQRVVPTDQMLEILVTYLQQGIYYCLLMSQEGISTTHKIAIIR